MEATVDADTEYRPVGFTGAVARQFRFLWQSRRPLLLLVGLLAGLFLLGGEPFNDGLMARLLTPWALWLIPIGPVWAFAVFHEEGPSNRLYLWSQPVGRASQTLARLVAGAAWLWLVYAALILIGWLVAVLDGNAQQIGWMSAAGWVNFFTAPLIGYLAVSALTVATEHPVRWFFVILLLIPLTMSLFIEWLELERVVRTLLEPITNQDWGIGLTMVGGWIRSYMVVQQELVGADGFGGGRDFPGDITSWWIATVVWILLFAGIVALLTRLHPDVLPRWRRGG